MNTISKMLKLATVSFIILGVLASCTSDDPSLTPTPPTSTISESSSVNLHNLVTLSGTAGDFPLDKLTITKNGSTAFLDYIEIDSVPLTDPVITLSGTDKSSFSYHIYIAAVGGESAIFKFDIDAENGDNTNETLTINSGPGLRITSHNGLAGLPSSLKTIGLIGQVGTSELNTIGLYEDDIAVDASRIQFAGGSAISNPIVLTGDQLNGFNESMTFNLHDEASTKSYRFVLTAVDAQEVEFAISYRTGNPVAFVQSDTVYNFDSPYDKGSVQIPEFITLVDADPDWDIRDDGNDSGGNWKGTFSVNADLELRKPAVGLIFSDLHNTEEINDAWNDATTTNGTSDQLSSGGFYFIQKNDVIYATKPFTLGNNNPPANVEKYAFFVRY